MDLTPEARRMLELIVRRTRSTRTQLLVWGNPEDRRVRRWALDELLSKGYVEVVGGWYMPA